MMKTKYKLLVKEGSYAEDSLIKLIWIVERDGTIEVVHSGNL